MRLTADSIHSNLLILFYNDYPKYFGSEAHMTQKKSNIINRCK